MTAVAFSTFFPIFSISNKLQVYLTFTYKLNKFNLLNLLNFLFGSNELGA